MKVLCRRRLRRVLAERIKVPDDARVRIRDCAGQRQLDAWLDRAAAETPIADLFG